MTDARPMINAYPDSVGGNLAGLAAFLERPGCAITEAITDGDLARTRWDSYLKLQREAEYAEDRIAHARERKRAGKVWDSEYRAAAKEGIVKQVRT